MDIRLGTTLEGPNGQTITIESLLGRGGLGQVFAGRLPDSTRVAVKTVLTASLNDNELRALQNEAKHAIGINHPNVVRVLYVNDGETTSGRPPYIVMDYVDGGVLRGVLERHKTDGTKLGVDELRAMYVQLAEGMNAVNARVVHRDVKPENVLVDVTGGRLKIADFGLAKLADAATRSETFKGWGTRPYQAPEAFEGGPNTPAMDMYATGVMFYEMATLLLPVQPKAGDNGPLAWRNAHLLTAPKDIRTLRSGLPMEMVQLIMQMLQKNPAKRPASWDEVVKRIKAGGTVMGGPDISDLLHKATSTFIRATEEETRARAERERLQERNALLEQAFKELIEILQALVDAYNGATSVGKIELRVLGPLQVEVKSIPGRPRLLLEGRIINDLDISYDGVIRILGVAQLDPSPKPRNDNEAFLNRDSFGSFNLVYRVSTATERFGEWLQFRFEINPLVPKTSYPRWFGINFKDLPRELQILNAMGVHQHERRPLDVEWFKELLAQML